jgi:hypothetical protein
LEGYSDSTEEQQKQTDLKIEAFLDKFDSCSNISKYCSKYRKPASVLNYILLYRGLEAILAPIPLYSKDTEALTEYQEVRPSKVTWFIENLGNNLESLDNLVDTADQRSNNIQEDKTNSTPEERIDVYWEKKRNTKLDAT